MHDSYQYIFIMHDSYRSAQETGGHHLTMRPSANLETMWGLTPHVGPNTINPNATMEAETAVRQRPGQKHRPVIMATMPFLCHPNPACLRSLNVILSMAGWGAMDALNGTPLAALTATSQSGKGHAMNGAYVITPAFHQVVFCCDLYACIRIMMLAVPVTFHSLACNLQMIRSAGARARMNIPTCRGSLGETLMARLTVLLVATNPMIARETSTYVLMDTHRGSIYTPPITMTLLDARSIPVSPQVHVTRCLRRCMILKRELHAEFHILMSVVR
jgi:hypothetical protein